MKEIKSFSASKLSQFMTCPRAYYHIYHLGFKLKKSDALYFGSAIHEGLAAFYTGGNLIKKFVAYVKKNHWQRPKGFNEEEHIKNGIRLLKMYEKDGTYLEPLDGWVEKLETAYLSNPANGDVLPIPFRLKIDLITKDGYLVDHKTSKSSTTKQNGQNRQQAIIYTMAYRSIFGKRPKGFIQNLIINQVRNPRVIATTFKYSEDDEAQVFDTITDVFEKIAQREYLRMQPMMRTFYKCPIGPLCDIHGGKK